MGEGVGEGCGSVLKDVDNMWLHVGQSLVLKVDVKKIECKFDIAVKMYVLNML